MSILGCFRKDLLIRKNKKVNNGITYIVCDPITGESFEFDDREYFLCQQLDGKTEISNIINRFEQQFHLSISDQNIQRFFRELNSYGLLAKNNFASAEIVGSASQSVSDFAQIQLRYGFTLWKFRDPNRFFLVLRQFLKPFRIFVWALLPLIILAIGTLISNWPIFWQDTTQRLLYIPRLWIILPTLLSINFLTQSLQAAVAISWGADIRDMRLFLLLGIIPRLIVDKVGLWTLTRQGRLWSFATPVLVRLSIFAIGTLIWHQNRAYTTGLATWAQTLIYIGLFGLIIEANPLWLYYSNGFGWLATYFGVDINVWTRSRKLWMSVLTGKPLPSLISRSSIIFLLVYGAIGILVNLVFILGLLIFLATLLEENLKGTGIVIFCIFIATASHLIYTVMMQKSKSGSSATASDSVINTSLIGSSEDSSQVYSDDSMLAKFLKQHWIKLMVAVGILGVMLLPYPYSVGGKIRLAAVQRREVQVNFSGKVVEVPFDGGDAQLIEAGSVIAVLESPNLENAVLTSQDQITAQEATLAQQRANLNQLLSTPRSTEISVQETALAAAKDRLEAAKTRLTIEEEELQVALARLEAAKTDVHFREQELERLEELYSDGAIALQRYEDVQRLTALARDQVKSVEANILVVRQRIEAESKNIQTAQRSVEQEQAQLDLLLSGPHPEAISEARQQVARAEADLKRLKQEQTYLRDESNRQVLRMPFDGTLSTGNLKAKLGIYLTQGDTFAIAENTNTIVGVIDVPEVQIDELSEQGDVNIRLLGYPNHQFKGRVSTIEPVARTDQLLGQVSINQQSGDTTQYMPERAGQVVSVIVGIEDDERILIPGMTGYAKIQSRFKPVIIAFTRPIVRFFQIEIWSWLP